MKILILTSRLPFPPDRGDRVRTYNFLRQMAVDHEISLISLIAHPRERENAEALQAFCCRIQTVLLRPVESLLKAARGLLSSAPLQVHYYRSRRLQVVLQQECTRFQPNLLYTHLFRMAPYGAQATNCYRVLDLTDVISSEIERSLPFRRGLDKRVYTLEKERIRRYEASITGYFDETWLISEQDVSQYRSFGNGANVTTVPNGVDTDQFCPLGGVPDPNSVIFSGHMGVPHNRDAVQYLLQDIVPILEKSTGELHIRVVGRESEHVAPDHADNGRVQRQGYVEDLNAVLNKAAVFVAPLRFAAGTQNKILEAMAAGLPVVTTALGNQGIGGIPGRHVLVGNNPEEFAAHVAQLLQQPAWARTIGLAGRAFVKERFRWSAVRERVNTIAAGLHTCR